MDCQDARALRHLYLDGEIGTDDTPPLEAHLRSCAGCAAIFRSDRELSAALKLGAPRYEAPEMLRARIRRELAARERGRRFGELRLLGVGWNPVAIAASLMLAVILGSALTPLVPFPAVEDRVADAVVASHIRSLMADNHLTDVRSTDQHTVKPWFNGKLDISPPVVDLASAGFPLIGGRLDYIDKRPVAALVYRRQQHVINVLVWPEGKSGATAPASLAERGYNLIHFDRDGMSLWVVSDLNAAELRDFVARLTEAIPDEDARR